MSKTSLLTIVTLLAIIVVAGVFTFFTSQESKRQGTDAFQALSVPEAANPYTDLEGNPIELTDYTGNVLVVNSWASWCPFCVTELQDFATLAKEYRDQGVVILAINRSESKEQVERFLNSVGQLTDITFVLDPDDNFYSSVGGFSMPETVFYDTTGELVRHKRGFMDLEEMRRHVEEAQGVSEDPS